MREDRKSMLNETLQLYVVKQYSWRKNTEFIFLKIQTLNIEKIKIKKVE